MEIFVSTLLTVLVSVITAFITFLFTKRLQDDQSNRTENVQESLQHTLWTLELWKEHEDKDMMMLRKTGSTVVKKYFDNQNNNLLRDKCPETSVYVYLSASSEAQENEYYDIIHGLAHFYERVAIQFNLGLLDDELFLKTLARPFMYNFKKTLLPFIHDLRAHGNDGTGLLTGHQSKASTVYIKSE